MLCYNTLNTIYKFPIMDYIHTLPSPQKRLKLPGSGDSASPINGQIDQLSRRFCPPGLTI